MKKIILLFVAVLGISSTFVSCSKSDSSDSASIVGKWEFSKEGVIVNGQEVLTNYVHTTGCTKDYSQFFDNNTMVDHSFENPGTGCTEYLDSYTYVKNGNTLTLTQGTYSISTTIQTLSSSTLKVKFTDPDTSEVYISVFTRIAN